MLAVFFDEDAVIGGIGWLNETQIGPDDLSFWVLSGELAGPDSRTCANVQNFSWGSNWCFV